MQRFTIYGAFSIPYSQHAQTILGTVPKETSVVVLCESASSNIYPYCFTSIFSTDLIISEQANFNDFRLNKQFHIAFTKVPKRHIRRQATINLHPPNFLKRLKDLISSVTRSNFALVLYLTSVYGNTLCLTLAKELFQVWTMMTVKKRIIKKVW